MTERDRPIEEPQVSSEELLKLIGDRPVAVNIIVHGELETQREGAVIANVKTGPISP